MRKLIQLPMLPFLGVIKLWQKFIAPGLAPRCKYYPSCSSYALTAISTHGLKGVVMATWRVLRCNPWSHGGVDYVRPKVKNNKKTITEQSLESMKAAA